jgi:predicted GNAT family acetyltransferase
MSNDSNDRIEFPDEAGYPDGTGTLSEDQSSQVAEVAATAGIDKPQASIEFFVVRDEEHGEYSAVVEDEQVGRMTFQLFGSRIALISTKVGPEYRGQGIATELIWRVLDDVRSRGETVTVICPLVRAFIDGHPEYASIVDPVHPGSSESS